MATPGAPHAMHEGCSKVLLPRDADGVCTGAFASGEWTASIEHPWVPGFITSMLDNQEGLQLPMGPYDSVFAVPPRDSQLSQVLERGSGGAAALAILYMEVLSCASMQDLMLCKPSPLSLDPHGA